MKSSTSLFCFFLFSPLLSLTPPFVEWVYFNWGKKEYLGKLFLWFSPAAAAAAG
jgi:hypothetical protein